MHEYCHRCGGELSASVGDSPFCPHCGSPQIYLQDYEEQSNGAGAGGVAADVAVDDQRIDDYAGAVSEEEAAGVDGCQYRGADWRGGGVGSGLVSCDCDGGCRVGGEVWSA